MRTIRLLLGACILLSLWRSSYTAGSRGASQGIYTITDLGMLPGCNGSYATAINDMGLVTGYCYLNVSPDGGSASEHAFVWKEGKITPLPTLGGKNCLSFAINDRGDIVGYAYTEKSHQPARWSTQGDVKVEALASSNGTAFAINQKGDMAGNLSSPARVVQWRSGQMTELRLSEKNDEHTTAMNGRGDILGYTARRDPNEPLSFSIPHIDNNRYQAFLWRDGKKSELAALGGAECFGAAMDETGTIVGWAHTAKKAKHACLWKKEVPTDLGGLDGETSEAFGINSSGDVVGQAQDKKYNLRAVLWKDGGIIDLNTLIPAGSGWDLSRASGINSRGQIIGQGFKGGSAHAFLLTPFP